MYYPLWRGSGGTFTKWHMCFLQGLGHPAVARYKSLPVVVAPRRYQKGKLACGLDPVKHLSNNLFACTKSHYYCRVMVRVVAASI